MLIRDEKQVVVICFPVMMVTDFENIRHPLSSLSLSFPFASILSLSFFPSKPFLSLLLSTPTSRDLQRYSFSHCIASLSNESSNSIPIHNHIFRFHFYLCKCLTFLQICHLLPFFHAHPVLYHCYFFKPHSYTSYITNIISIRDSRPKIKHVIPSLDKSLKLNYNFAFLTLIYNCTSFILFVCKF